MTSPDTIATSIKPTTSTALVNSREAFGDLVDLGLRLSENRHAANTRKAYRSDFNHFVDWCEHASNESGTHLEALPAEPATVWLYLSALVANDNAAGYKIATLERRLSAIKWMHETNGHPSPTTHTRIRELIAGIRRTYGAPKHQVEPLTTDQIARMISTLDLDTTIGIRNRALLLIGYASAMRRSELANINRHDLHRSPDGIRIHLTGSKDDQEHHGRHIGIPHYPNAPLCPVAALDAWLTHADITNGPVFRRVDRHGNIATRPLAPGSIPPILKKMAATAGIPADRIAGHSLRAGHATTAHLNGATDRAIMNQTGHKSADTLNHYIRPHTTFRNNSTHHLGLDTSQ